MGGKENGKTVQFVRILIPRHLATAILLPLLVLFSARAPALVLAGTTVFNGAGDNADQATAVVVDADGNILVAGHEQAIGGAVWRIRKYDATLGTVLATTSYSGPAGDAFSPKAMAINTSGSVYVAGDETGVSGFYNWRINKYDASLGILLASTDYNGPGNNSDYVYAVALDGSGNVIVAGQESGATGSGNWRIRKYDSSLTTLLGSTEYNGPANSADLARAVAVDSGGNILVAGGAGFVGTSTDWLIRKYAPDLGTVLASTTYDMSNKVDAATAMALGPTGEVYVGGYEGLTVADCDWRIRRYDASLGTLLSSALYQGTSNGYEQIKAIAINASGNVVAGGVEKSIKDWRLVVYDSSLGAVLSSTVFTGPGNNNDYLYSVAVTSSGGVIAVGSENNPAFGGVENWRINLYSAQAALQSCLTFSSANPEPGQLIQVRLTVTNSGDADASGIDPGIEINLGSTLVTYVSGPAPPGPASLSAGSSVTFSWTYSINGPGTVTFTASAEGADSSSLEPVSTASSGSIVAAFPPQLTPLLSAFPQTLFPGDAIVLTMKITNTGMVPVFMKPENPPVLTGVTLAGLSLGPTPVSATILAGSNKTFTWVYTAGTALGSVSFSVSINGTDLSDGSPLTTGLKTAGPVTVSTVAGACPLVPVYEKIYDRFGGYDRGYGITVKPTGEPILAEQKDFYLFGQEQNIRVAKYGLAGALVWEYSYDTPIADSFDRAYAVARNTATGTIYAAGVADGSIWTAAIDDDSNLLWLRIMTPSATLAEARGIAVDTAGNSYVTGKFPRYDLSENDNLVLIKYAPDGTTEWTAWYNSPANRDEGGYGVALDPTGSYVYVVGFEDRLDLGQGRDILFLKYDATTGAQLLKWSYSSPGAGYEEGRGIAVDTAGDIYACGYENRADLGQGRNGWLAKYSPGGTMAWYRTFNSPNMVFPDDVANGIGISPGGEILVVGQQVFNFSNGSDITVRRYSRNGELREAIQDYGAANQGDAGSAVSFDAVGNIYATGWKVKNGSQYEDVWLKKYNAPVCMRAALSASPDPVSTGAKVTVVMTVTNTGGTAINSLAPSIHAGPGGGLVVLFSGPTPADASLNPGDQASFTWVFDTAGTGTVTLTATVAGYESTTGQPIEAYAFGSVVVGNPASLVASLYAPASSCDGTIIQVQMTVTNNGDCAATNVAPSATLFFEGVNAIPVVRPAPLPLLAGGASHTFTWSVSAYGYAVMRFTATLTAMDNGSGLAITTGPVVSGTMNFGAGSILAAHLTVPTTPVPVGGWFTVELTVTNSGGGAITGSVRPMAVSPAGAAVFPVDGPVPAGSLSIPAGGIQSFSWTYSVSGGGRVYFTASFTGADFCSPSRLVSATGFVDIGLPASLEASVLTVSPDPVCTSSLVLAVMTVTNTGQVAADWVSGSPVLSVEGSAVLVAQPAQIQSLAPGASARLTWTYSATAAGTLKFTASVYGGDSRDGSLLMAGPSPSNVVTVTQPAVLSATASIPSSASVGQWVTVTLTVTNTGGQNAVAIRPSASVTVALTRTVSGPSPAGPITIPPGNSQTFSWTYSISGRGTIQFTLSAEGTTCAGRKVFGRSTGILAAKSPAKLAILSFVMAPSAIRLQGPFSGSLVVKNTGEAQATLTGYSLTTTGLALPVGSDSLPNIPLLGGASLTVSWTFTTWGSSCGSALAQASVDGIDVNSGVRLRAGPANSNAVNLSGSPTGLSFISPPATASTAQPVALTVLARDSCLNAVPGYPVYFAVTQGAGTVSPLFDTSDGLGYAHVVLNTPLEPDSESVLAYLDGTGISATAIIAAENPLALDEPGAALDKNSFVASNGEFVLARVRPKPGASVEDIKVKVFTASGRLVKYLIARDPMGENQWTVKWNGTTEEGYAVARGVYLVQVSGGGISAILKVVVK
jgi:hypothetical protein